MHYRFDINVTEDDIKHGEPGNCRYCPVARACNRVMSKNGFIVNVTSVDISIGHGNLQVLSVPMPSNVDDFVEVFDSHGHVVPFSFVLEFDI